jgi:hypothetical protein
MCIKHVRIIIKVAWNIRNYGYVWDVSETTGEPSGTGEVYYKEPNLSGGIEGVDCGIVHGEVDLQDEEEQ